MPRRSLRAQYQSLRKPENSLSNGSFDNCAAWEQDPPPPDAGFNPYLRIGPRSHAPAAQPNQRQFQSSKGNASPRLSEHRALRRSPEPSPFPAAGPAITQWTPPAVSTTGKRRIQDLDIPGSGQISLLDVVADETYLSEFA